MALFVCVHVERRGFKFSGCWLLRKSSMETIFWGLKQEDLSKAEQFFFLSKDGLLIQFFLPSWIFAFLFCSVSASYSDIQILLFVSSLFLCSCKLLFVMVVVSFYASEQLHQGNKTMTFDDELRLEIIRILRTSTMSGFCEAD